jgi:hypothetical protein
VRKSSFLGMDPGYECAATTDQECRMSRQCRTHGRCARVGSYDVGCGADSAEQCGASLRCKTREECALDSFECVRRWSECPALVVPDAPSWLTPIDLVWDYDSLRTPWQPGDVDGATLACRVEAAPGPASVLRVAGRCAPAPGVGGSRASAFLRADVTLHRGDAIAISVQDGPIGHASSGFAQLHYDGASPVRGGDDGDSLECVVVPHATALERSRRELAAVDRGLADSARERPDPDDPRALPGSLESARVHAERAALWLGWRDPELAVRVKKLDAAAQAWHVKLDEAIRKAAPPPDARPSDARPSDARASDVRAGDARGG